MIQSFNNHTNEAEGAYKYGEKRKSVQSGKRKYLYVEQL